MGWVPGTVRARTPADLDQPPQAGLAPASREAAAHDHSFARIAGRHEPDAEPVERRGQSRVLILGEDYGSSDGSDEPAFERQLTEGGAQLCQDLRRRTGPQKI